MIIIHNNTISYHIISYIVYKCVCVWECVWVSVCVCVCLSEWLGLGAGKFKNKKNKKDLNGGFPEAISIKVIPSDQMSLFLPSEFIILLYDL